MNKWQNQAQPTAIIKMPPADQQRDADALYKKIYTAIQTAKLDADKHDKRLVIAVGESHGDVKSFLTELMILDACKQIGIRNFAPEVNKPILDGFKKITDGVVQIASKTIADSSLNRLSEETRKNIEMIATIKELQPMIQKAMDNNSNLGHLVMYSKHMGMSTFPSAPFHGTLGTKLRTDPNAAIKPEITNAMVDAIYQTPKHCVAVMGRQHMPHVSNGLASKGRAVCNINTTPVIENDYAQHAVTPQLVDTYNQVSKFDVLRIAGDSPMTHASAVMLATVAALNHRSQSSEHRIKTGAKKDLECLTSAFGEKQK